MNNATPPIDISTMPDLARLAEEVRASRQPRLLQKNGEPVAMVMPVAARPAAREEVSSMERQRAALFTRPSAEELARRQALVTKILEERKTRVISPLDSSDLVRQVREEEARSYDDRR